LIVNARLTQENGFGTIASALIKSLEAALRALPPRQVKSTHLV
jgi:hypothetical protein